MSLSSEKRLLLSILLVALLVRLGLVGVFPREMALLGDSYDYLAISENILSGKGFLGADGSLAGRTPLYPLYMALLGRDILLIQLGQVLLGVLGGVLIYSITKMLFKRDTGLICGAIFALHPYLAVLCIFVLEDTLFGILVLLEFYFLCRGIKKGLIKDFLLAGLASGLATLAHPAHLLSWIFILPAVWILVKKKARIGLMGFLLIHFAILLPWTLRNYFLLGKFVPLTTHLGRTLFESLGPGATGGPAADKVLWPEEIKMLGEYQKDRFLLRRTFELVKEDPCRALALSQRKLARFFNIIPNELSFRSSVSIFLSALFMVPFYGFVLWGIGAMFRRERHLMYLLFCVVLYYTALHMVFVGSIFYRMVVEPILVIFAGYGGQILISFIFKKTG